MSDSILLPTRMNGKVFGVAPVIRVNSSRHPPIRPSESKVRRSRTSKTRITHAALRKKARERGLNRSWPEVSHTSRSSISSLPGFLTLVWNDRAVTVG